MKKTSVSTAIEIADPRNGLNIVVNRKGDKCKFISIKLTCDHSGLPRWKEGEYARIKRSTRVKGHKPKRAQLDVSAKHIVADTLTPPAEVVHEIGLKITSGATKRVPILEIHTFGYRGHRPMKGRPVVTNVRRLNRQEIALLRKAIESLEPNTEKNLHPQLVEQAKKAALKYVGFKN